MSDDSTSDPPAAAELVHELTHTLSKGQEEIARAAMAARQAAQELQDSVPSYRAGRG